MTATDDAYFHALREHDPEQLYDRAPCGYLTTSSDGTIRKVNRTFLDMTGYRADELIGTRRFVDLLSAGGRIYHETHYAPMLQMGGTVRELAFDLLRTDGSALPVLVNAAAEPVADLVRIAVFDATHRRAYERELLRAKQRAEESEANARALARTLQQTLIPPVPPEIPHLDLATEYRPAGDGTEVGGDFYDVFQVGPDDWVIIVGDVRGKGAHAAVVTALARYTLRAAAMVQPGPAATLHRLNDVMRQYRVDRFCTLVMLRLRQDADRWHAVIASAGHPLPILRAADGSTRAVGRHGTLLGVFPDPAIHDVPLDLAPGDTVLLYTDGLPEGRGPDGFYGEQRIHALARQPHESAASLVDALLADVLAFQGDNPRDDIALVAVRAHR